MIEILVETCIIKLFIMFNAYKIITQHIIYFLLITLFLKKNDNYFGIEHLFCFTHLDLLKLMWYLYTSFNATLTGCNSL